LEMSGDSSYSPVINIPVLTANGSETSVNINPKPNDRVMINMSIPFASKVTIEIENPAGQNIYRKEINQFSGVSSQQIDLSQQTWGIYLVSVSNEDYKFVKKIVIK
ncbi:MAG: hypothetical protein JWO06_3485, partial [Bacteroidota bacterium]|nr:hypothetical protein [Bacteroidota bacterium]